MKTHICHSIFNNCIFFIMSGCLHLFNKSSIIGQWDHFSFFIIINNTVINLLKKNTFPQLSNIIWEINPSQWNYWDKGWIYFKAFDTYWCLPIYLYFIKFCFPVHFASQHIFCQVIISAVPKEHFSKQMPTYMITEYTKAGEINPGMTQAKEKPKQVCSCSKVVKLSS